MPKAAVISKVIAATFIVLTISVIGGMVTMIILYRSQISGMNPTPRPTLPPTTTLPPPVMRLPKNLIPESYTIFLQPHFYTQIIEKENVTSPNQTLLFTGNSTVVFHCVLKTSTIYLHSKDLVVSNPVVVNKNKNQNMRISSMTTHDDESDFLTIEINEPLEEEQTYSLFLNFKGEISENLDGLYLSSYVEGYNAQRFLVATDLQPTGARRVFPCFDEPEMKATFDLTIIHRQETYALSNAKQKDSSIRDNWKYTEFYTTPKMSTYLFAFTVSEFKDFTPSPHEKVEINIYARPEAVKAQYTEYAASVTGKILMFFESQFGNYDSLKKLYQIALPDLYPAAMENWGLVTYQEGSLLYEEGVSSLLHKEAIAVVIAHELAHQWFGNLVTMKWWNDAWLNEGFATYLSYLAVDNVEGFNIKNMYALNDLHIAFQEDALASSHPLSPPQEDIQTTSQITAMFDSITYSKGASVLRMVADHVGQETFNDAIKLYVKELSYGNTEQKNLWEYIVKVGGTQDIAKNMGNWIKLSGYPVITINTTNGEIYQKHFLFNKLSSSSNMWYIPIKVMTETSNSYRLVLQETSDKVQKEELISKNGEWILANVDCVGYYRVNYNPENWELLLTQLEREPQRIPLMNRAQLIDDAFNLARAKLVDVTLALNTTYFLYNETEYLPWESAFRNLEYFVLMFDRSEVYGPMQTYFREQVKGLYNLFKNYTDKSQVPDDHSKQYNQINAIQVACSSGLPECVTMAKDMFDFWMTNGTNIIHPNLRSVIYCQAMAAGENEEWEFAWNKFQNTNNTSEKEQLRKALSCTKKIWLLSRYLEYTLNPEKIRLMDVASTISYIAKNEAGQALAWNFVRAHWDSINQGDGAMVIEEVTSRFSTKFELQELERFKKEYDLGPATRAVEQAIEQTQVNIQWVSDNKDIILEWFKSQT